METEKIIIALVYGVSIISCLMYYFSTSKTTKITLWDYAWRVLVSVSPFCMIQVGLRVFYLLNNRYPCKENKSVWYNISNNQKSNNALFDYAGSTIDKLILIVLLGLCVSAIGSMILPLVIIKALYSLKDYETDSEKRRIQLEKILADVNEKVRLVEITN